MYPLDLTVRDLLSRHPDAEGVLAFYGLGLRLGDEDLSLRVLCRSAGVDPVEVAVDLVGSVSTEEPRAASPAGGQLGGSPLTARRRARRRRRR